MLNMGFVDDVELILNAGGAEDIQTLLFSATLPGWVKDIQKRFLKKDFKLVDLVGNEKQKVPHNNTIFKVRTSAAPPLPPPCRRLLPNQKKL